MSARQLFALPLIPIARWLRQLWTKRRLAAIGRHLAFIQHERENGFHAERFLHAEQALLQSKLRGF